MYLISSHLLRHANVTSAPPVASTRRKDRFSANPEKKGHLSGRYRMFLTCMAISFDVGQHVPKKGDEMQPPPANTPEWQL